MRRPVLGEAIRAAVADRVLFVLMASASVASIVFGVLAVGGTISTERAAIGAIDEVTTRLVTFEDQSGSAAIESSSVAVFKAMDSVEFVLAVGFAESGSNASFEGAPTVPVRAVSGDVEELLDVPSGRVLSEPVLYLTPSAVEDAGFITPVGALEVGSRSVPVHGLSVPHDTVRFLDGSALKVGGSEGFAKAIYVVATSADRVGHLAQIGTDVLVAEKPLEVSVESSEAYVRLGEVLAGRLGAGSRRSLGFILFGAAVIVGTVALAAGFLRQTDIGRRRVMGASRTDIAIYALAQTVVPFAVAAALANAGLGITRVLQPDVAARLGSIQVQAALTYLSLIVAVVAATPGALFATSRDPVLVLRTP